jgi:hypothetical protein
MPFDTRNNAFEYASPFEYSNEANLIITNLGLFEEENHTKNSILLDKILIESNETAPEKMPYAQSDWNTPSALIIPAFSMTWFTQTV